MKSSEEGTGLEINVGEQYRYRTGAYEIIAVKGERVQLRGLDAQRNIIIIDFKRLAKANLSGNFQKIQEAPFKGKSSQVISSLTKTAREKFDRKLAYVTGCLKKLKGRLPRPAAVAEIFQISADIGDSKPPSYSSVYNWIRSYLNSGENCLALLSKKVKERKPRVFRQPDLIQDIIQYCLDCLYYIETPCSISAVVETIQFLIDDHNEGRPISDKLNAPSKSTIRRIINELDAYETDLYQLGLRAAQKRQTWSIRHTKLRHLLVRVECDTQVLDIYVVDKYGRILGRPFLTVVLEVSSRRIIGWDISLNPPSIEKTIRAIKNSLNSAYERNGLALHYVVDNGSEFVAKKLRDCLTLLGARITFCAPGKPNQKPFVERWFRTLNMEIIHTLKGTCFSNIVERGDYDSEKEAIFTIDHVREVFNTWLEDVYHISFHQSLNTSPNDFWDSHQDPVFPARRYSEEDLRRHFLSVKYVTPANGRVGFSHLEWTGPSVSYLSTLGQSRCRNKQKYRKPKLVLYYDPSDLGAAYVCHPDLPDDVYPIIASDADYQDDLTLHMHKLVQAEIKEQRCKFDFRTARNNRARLNLKIADELRKRGKKRHARMLEAKTINLNSGESSALAIQTEEVKNFLIDPDKHLARSTTPREPKIVELLKPTQLGEIDD
ncbi:DDE-type integrase/transposase/recombinase [Pseudomonas pseudonitroreducens]|uniref:DDE-type integrase/transposase/recombinase n=1 Tax=Pseudomonas pseudonitroreducens TaxID=2892326 RepID=UPI001F15811F|nr:DDE-type integrase/transposase/recombinase [Pseudomonas pseudonitroreducens]